MSGRLERRYRRLLAWYPVEHRRIYEEEMLGVLMAGAAPDQRYPGPREAVNLAWSALHARLRRDRAGIRDPQWADAATALGLLVPALLLVPRIGALAWRLVWSVQDGDVPIRHLAGDLLVVAGWLVTALAVLVGWRRTAAVAAWVGTLALAWTLASAYPTDPVGVLHRLGGLALAVTTAVALLVRAAGRGRDDRAVAAVLGRRGTLLLGLAGLAATGAAVLDPLTTRAIHHGDESFFLPPSGPGVLLSEFVDRPVGWDVLGLCVVAGIIALAGVASLAAPLRRRFLALVAPAVVLDVVIRQAFAGFMVSSVRFNPPVLLVPGQWLVLVATAVLTLAAGVVIVRRREHTLHLARLGRAVLAGDAAPGRSPAAGPEAGDNAD